MKWGQDTISCISPSYTFHHGLCMDVVKCIKEFDPTIYIDLGQVSDVILPLSIKVANEDIVQASNEKYVYHDYQLRSVSKGLKFGRGIFELATSAGKSLIIYGLIRNYVQYHAQDMKFLILVPGKQLVAQMSKDLEDYGWDPKDICRFTAEGDREYKGQRVIVSNTSWVLLHGDELP